MGTDWRGEGNNERNYSIESRGWAAHKSLIFVSKACSYNLEHPGKQTFPLKKKSFSACSQTVRATGFHFFGCQGTELVEWYLFHTNSEELKG